MMRLAGLVAAVAAIGLAIPTSSRAADPRFPDWPCVQAKVPELSVAAVWAGPAIDEAAKTWEQDQRVRDLVARIGPRRLPIEDAGRSVAEFVTGNPAEREQKAKLLFAGLFERLNRERTEVMNGIERFSRRQKALAARIRSDISELHKIQDAPNPDEAKLNDLGHQVEWSTRIFEERRKTIHYVCEVPVEIERRLFALGRAVQQAME